MPSLRELRTKVKSVKSTQQITKAMKMVAAARLNRAQERIMSARPFADKMQTLLQELAHIAQNQQDDTQTHPFLRKRTGKRVDVVLITADRGLCGGFNAHLIRHTIGVIRDHKEDDLRLWLAGKKGRDFFARTNVTREKEYINIFQNLGYHDAEIIGQEIIDTFLNTETRAIHIVYNEFKSRIQQRLVSHQILPIQSVPEAQPRQDFLYEPTRAEILEELFPRYIKAQIFRMLLESQAAELAARMTAMDNATRNAGDLINSLTLTMNKIRQATITKEIAEIVGGAEALQAN